MATPIGNLADISLRALHVLGLMDTIACEDTRHTQTLLRACGLDSAAARLLAVHEHNESGRPNWYCSACACVPPEGSLCQRRRNPGISDPGARLVAAVQAQGLRSVPLPGASSPPALISVAGLPDFLGAEGGFVFKGFSCRANPANVPGRCRNWRRKHARWCCWKHRTGMQALADALATLGDAASRWDAN